MKIYLALTIASLKMYFRNKQALFWALFFPLLIMIIFGIMNFDRYNSPNVGIYDAAKNPASQALQHIIKFDKTTLTYHNLHRWRYANIAKQEGEKSLFDPNLKLGLCGDWLISGRVENAFLSGIDLAQKL